MGTVERHLQILEEKRELTQKLVDQEGLDILEASDRAWNTLFKRIMENL